MTIDKGEESKERGVLKKTVGSDCGEGVSGSRGRRARGV